MEEPTRIPLLEHDVDDEPVFVPANLLDGARRQKGLAPTRVPSGCLLDMDGELVERLVTSGRAARDPSWPCFHTTLYRWAHEGTDIGIIGGTIGAPFAVLVAEELFASGCEALVSMTSAGLIAADAEPPFFVLIDRALRDEGTSHHYLAPSRYVEADAGLSAAVGSALRGLDTPVLHGASWTTDAPFCESETLIASRRREGIVSVEMEAAALLAMSHARHKAVMCLAHVTNAMATRPEDFDKGGHDGQEEALDVCARSVLAALAYSRSKPSLPTVEASCRDSTEV